MSSPLYRERTMGETLESAAAAFPCVLLTGARQVGKSTLLQRLREKGQFAHDASPDDFATAAAARRDPVLFPEMHAIPLGRHTLGKGIVFCPITTPLPLGDGHLALSISAL